MTPERRMVKGLPRYVASEWSEIEPFLPEGLSREELAFLEGYFQVQRLIVTNNLEEANDVMQKLLEMDGYCEFEETKEAFCVAVEKAVRGETNRKYVECAFEFEVVDAETSEGVA